jgi:hypothetical protein
MSRSSRIGIAIINSIVGVFLMMFGVITILSQLEDMDSEGFIMLLLGVTIGYYSIRLFQMLDVSNIDDYEYRRVRNINVISAAALAVGLLSVILVSIIMIIAEN